MVGGKGVGGLDTVGGEGSSSTMPNSKSIL